MTEELTALASTWEAAAWQAQREGQPLVSQALVRCAADLRHLVDEDRPEAILTLRH